MTRSATALIFCGFATEVPPNFCTINAIGACCSCFVMLKKSGSPPVEAGKNPKTQCAPLLFFFQPNKLFRAGFSRYVWVNHDTCTGRRQKSLVIIG
jgi:hypothetical protein